MILLMRALDNLFFLKKAVVRQCIKKIKAEFTFVNEHLIFENKAVCERLTKKKLYIEN